MRRKDLWDYPQVIEKMSDRLFNNLEAYDMAIYGKFFIERHREACDLVNAIRQAERSNRTIFLIGDRGVGKTTFLKWFLKKPRYSDGFKGRTIFLDIKKATSTVGTETFANELRRHVVTRIIEYMKTVTKGQDQCHDLDQEEQAHGLEAAFEKAHKKILAWHRGKSPLIVFVDDVDYAELVYLPSLLNILNPFMMYKESCALIAVRRPAYNAIMSHRDYPITVEVPSAVTRCELSHLCVDDVLDARLELLCSSEKSNLKQKIQRWKRILENFDDLWELLRSLFLSPVKAQNGSPAETREEVSTIKVPYTHSQHAFMQAVSNGNVRYILEMAKQFLLYMRNNKDKIREQGQGYWIGRAAIIDHFKHSNIWGKIRIQNLHRKKSHKFTSPRIAKLRGIPHSQIGNSLYVVLLEFLKEPESVDAGSMEFFQEYGFSKDEVNEGIQDLWEMEMIEEEELPISTALGGYPRRSSKNFYVTARGRYYREYMMYWKEYIDVYGQSTHQKIGRGIETEETIQHLLLYFTINIFYARQLMSLEENDFRVSRQNFYNSFVEYYKESLQRLYRTELSKQFLLDSEIITRQLTRLGIIQTHEVEGHEYYLFREHSTDRICVEKGIKEVTGEPWKTRPPYSPSFFKKMIQRYVRKPDYEVKKDKKGRRKHNNG